MPHFNDENIKPRKRKLTIQGQGANPEGAKTENRFGAARRLPPYLASALGSWLPSLCPLALGFLHPRNHPPCPADPTPDAWGGKRSPEP